MIVNMVFNLNKIFKKNYQKSKKKHNLILIKFDNFVLKPKKYLDLVNDAVQKDKLMGMIQSKIKDREVYKVGCLGKISDYQKSNDYTIYKR